MEENKLSYEELEQRVIGLQSMNQQLMMQIQKMDLSNVLKRLDYLFKVLEQGHYFNTDFVDKVVQEIESTITVPEEETEKTED